MESSRSTSTTSSMLPTAMTDRRLIIVPKPTASSGILASVFNSSLNKASRMLISVATSEDATPADADPWTWRAMDHLRHALMLTIWANVWVLRTLTNAFPSSSSSSSAAAALNIHAFISPKEQQPPSSSSSSSSSSSALIVHTSQAGAVDELHLFSANSTAIGRTLSHVLETLNQIPATSRKYEYVLATADRILSENIHHGHPSLLQVSRSSLGAAFSRTTDLLRRSLRSPDRSIFFSSSSSSSWHSKVLHLLPPGPRRLYEGFRICLNSFLPSIDDANSWQRSYKPQRHATITGPRVGAFEWGEAEKLAQELLWITQKLCDCGGASEAIVRWSFASGLASLVLTAHPRVQAPIVKITVILIRELERGEWYAVREVQFGILALWLPVLCYATNGVTSPAVSGPERYETEQAIEELIGGLPNEDQEVILQNWLEDFAASDSDWPNLSRCFDRFCRLCRKQVLLLE